MRSLVLQVLLFVTAQAITNAGLLGGQWSGWQDIEKIFCFGDSYSEVGFTASSKTQPSVSDPLAPNYNADRAFLLDKWITHLTTKYNSSAILTYDLAVVGASISPLDNRPPLNYQIDSFNSVYGPQQGSLWKSTNTLFPLFIGINDVDLSTGNTTTSAKWSDTFKYFATYVSTLYASGARNFLFFGVPALDRAPGRSASNIAQLKQTIPDVNRRILALAKALASQADQDGEGSVWYFDTSELFDELLADPGALDVTSGIKDTTTKCDANAGSDPQSSEWKGPGCQYEYGEYFWRDGLHVTDAVHQAIAQMVSIGFEATTTSMSSVSLEVER